MSAAGPPRPPAGTRAPAPSKVVSPAAAPVAPRVPAAPQTPRSPPVQAAQPQAAPAQPPAAAPADDEGAWDAPTHVRDDPEATAPRAAIPASVVTTEMREQIWAIVRAAVEEAVAPLHKSLSAAERRIVELENRPAVVQTVQVLSPAPAAAAPAPKAVVVAAPAPIPQAAPTPRVLPDVSSAPAVVDAPAAPAAPRPSQVIGEDATGLVSVSLAPPEQPLPGSDRSSPIPGDFVGAFDASRRHRRIATVVVLVLLAGVGALVVAMMLSYRP